MRLGWTGVLVVVVGWKCRVDGGLGVGQERWGGRCIGVNRPDLGGTCPALSADGINWSVRTRPVATSGHALITRGALTKTTPTYILQSRSVCMCAATESVLTSQPLPPLIPSHYVGAGKGLVSCTPSQIPF